jgi:hypothetical protein
MTHLTAGDSCQRRGNFDTALDYYRQAGLAGQTAYYQSLNYSWRQRGK